MLPAATEVQDDAGCFLKLARVIKRRLRRPVAKNGDTFAYSRFYGFPTGAVISEGQMTRVKQEWIKALKERGLDYKPIPLPDISFEPMIGCRVKVPMPDIN